MTRAARTVLVALLLSAGCARSSQTIDLKAAFSEATVVGQLLVTWRASDRPLDAAAAQETVTVRVDAANRLADPLYLRLAALRLIGPHGPIGLEPAGVGCVLPAHTTRTLVEASVPVPGDGADIRGIDVEQLAVPLSERGRAFYREFLLLKRPGAHAAIDGELEAYAAAPACPGAPQ